MPATKAALPITFALEAPTVEEAMVLRSGKIFETGVFEDKGFSMTAEEMAAAVADFQPVPVDLEHTPTLLEGKLGELRAVALSEDGTTLNGTVALPKWLDDALGDVERKVSATWDRATKRLQGLALVRNPRVADAALMSAYASFASKHQTPTGMAAMQDVHDVTIRHGATCKRSNAAEMASSGEAKAIQTAHDITAEHGAQCEDMAAKLGKRWDYGRFSAGATGTHTPPKETRTMSRFDQFMSYLRGDDDEPNPQPDPQPIPPQPQPAAARMAASDANSEALRQANDRAARFEAENRRLLAERIQTGAAAFAEKYIEAGRAFPAERDAIVFAYTQAATDDTVHGTVQFANGQTGTRVDALAAAYNARPQNQLTTEQLAPDMRKMFALGSEASDKARTQAEKDREVADEMLRSTKLGQDVLAARTNGSSRN